MPRSTDFCEGDIVRDYKGKRHYLLINFIRTNEDYDLFFALCLENGNSNTWGFDHFVYRKVA
jgi:hypothetical protein